MTARPLAWSLAALGVVLLLATYGLDLANGHGLVPSSVGTLVLLAISVVGALIASRRPRNPLGWLYLVAAILIAFGGSQNLAQQYAYNAVVTRGGALPAADWVLWSGEVVVIPAFGGLITFGLLFFPDGRLPSPRWRLVAVAAVLALADLTALEAIAPGVMHGSLDVVNPVGAPALFWGPWLGVITLVLVTVGLGGCVASVFVRFRRAIGLERQQLKWFAYGAAWIPAVGLVGLFLSVVAPVSGAVANDLFPLSVAGIPIATAIAILRHRLYDIDLLINRTLVYGALSAVLAATYFLAVLGFETVLRPLTAGSEVAVALSTLSVVALFAPLRRRIQGAVDRRFYRARYDAARTLDRFGEQLRDEVDLEAVRASLLDAVEQTVRPTQASIWLRVE